MTRHFPDRVTRVGNDLTRLAGSYLHSVTTGDWSACQVCALPIDPAYTLCVQCQNHRRSRLPLADRVGFLVYADEPLSQTYRTMRGYKEHRTRATFESTVQALLAVGLRGHFTCANKLAEAEESGWAVVPSTRGRTALVDLVRSLTTSPAAEIWVSMLGAKPDRTLNPASWVIAERAPMAEHVVIIDDAWVTGSSSQSLAATLKQAGTSQVSVLSVARVLSPRWSPNTRFLQDILPSLRYDWTICPWTLGDCP